MKVYYSCLVDDSPKYQYESWLWVKTLIEFAKILPENIWVHYIVANEEDDYLKKMASTGVNLVRVNSFGDMKYCNKIVQLSNDKLYCADAVILMDTDTFLTEDISGYIDFDKVNGRVVTKGHPPTFIFEDILTKANIKNAGYYPKVIIGDYKTIHGNLNGGLYIIPQRFLVKINKS
ncbi:MAG: hypothetical protein LBV33_00555, partial [Lachnospiraceae bacterium]|nr:hypothetical protein [Lachnospiraceae bacterium]